MSAFFNPPNKNGKVVLIQLNPNLMCFRCGEKLRNGISKFCSDCQVENYNAMMRRNKNRKLKTL